MSSSTSASESWQRQLAESFTDLAELCRFLQLDSKRLPLSSDACQLFPLRVTRHFAGNMTPGDANDPLLRQVLALSDELEYVQGFTTDPVGDHSAHSAPGILHKYHGRALLVTTGACAIHCRYCFRRNFSYQDHQLTGRNSEQALAYIAEHCDLEEIILSGGDPLMLSDARLTSLIERLTDIPHLKRLRLHSRLPVVLPDRINPALLTALTESRLNCVMVIHANHAQELCPNVADACLRLREHGVSMLNQSVLLHGVNDTVESLRDLSERLFTIGVLPYYLHLLDRAQGTAHFEVSEAVAIRLHETIRAKLPGYLVPRLVRETAGAPAKQPIV
ncbi:MAG: EF-P beta-lysylation protein EpmB [Methylococcales bacterium]|nr:EF-P beta-lysylation protein EpmB [Methylococcales bacterium]